MANPNSSAQRSFAAEPYDSVAAVLASKQITAALVGQRVFTKDGFAYEVVEAAQSNWRRATAGGARLRVLPVGGVMYAEAFRVIVDATGSVDNADDLEDWVSAAVAGRHAMAWPEKAGRLYSSRVIKLPTSQTYNNMATGIQIRGTGAGLILTRKEIGRSKFSRLARSGVVIAAGQGCFSDKGAVFINNTDSSVTLTGSTRASLISSGLVEGVSELIDECFLAVLGSNYKIGQLRFEDCAVGWYLGGDNISTQQMASFNNLEEFICRNCSISGVMLTGVGSGSGCYYNRIKGYHSLQSQFGLIQGYQGAGLDNNNRNSFTDLRATRCQVGFATLGGDTNTFITSNTENCTASNPNNRYAAPEGLPDGRDTWAWINTGLKQKYISCVDEGSTNVMYSSDPEMEWHGTYFRENEVNAANSLFTVPPRGIFTGYTFYTNSGRMSAMPDRLPNMIPNRESWPSVRGRLYVEDYLALRDPTIVTPKVSSVDRIYNLEAMAASETKTYALWPATTSGDYRNISSAALFDVDVIGNGTIATSAVIISSFKVGVWRNASGVPEKYAIFDKVDQRVNGAGSSDTTNPFAAAVSVSGNDVTLTITCGAQPMLSAMLRVKANFSRP